jgi:hypothetical protein
MTAASRWSLSDLYVLKSTWASELVATASATHRSYLFEQLLLVVLELAHHVAGRVQESQQSGERIESRNQKKKGKRRREKDQGRVKQACVY